MFPILNTLGLVIHENHLLLELFHGPHSKGDGDYYRPIGGKIEFGESSREALHREFLEELNLLINIKDYITCVENIFTIKDEIGHEVSLVYEVEFEDVTRYQQTNFLVQEGRKRSQATWISIQEIINDEKFLYPEELKQLLKGGPPS